MRPFPVKGAIARGSVDPLQGISLDRWSLDRKEAVSQLSPPGHADEGARAVSLLTSIQTQLSQILRVRLHTVLADTRPIALLHLLIPSQAAGTES